MQNAKQAFYYRRLRRAFGHLKMPASKGIDKEVKNIQHLPGCSRSGSANYHALNQLVRCDRLVFLLYVENNSDISTFPCQFQPLYLYIGMNRKF